MADLAWSPLLPGTPDHPEYPSAHSCITPAGGRVIARFLGTKQIDLTIPSLTGLGDRHFATVSDLQYEVGNARIWGGIHYRSAVEQGIVIGKRTVKQVREAGSFGLAVPEAMIYPLAMLSVSAVDSPIGELTLARGPRGLLRLALAGETPQSVAEDLRGRLDAKVVEDDAAFPDLREQLDRYFAGELQEFDVELDWTLAHGFHRACCEAMMRIPYGVTVTYAELAASAGSPRAVRAAGQACATNPIAIIGPCHRVLASDGFGGYGGGLDQKCALLKLEGALLVA
jgi:methylated-DNA-[protein]-cysteine S-methyltransferase